MVSFAYSGEVEPAGGSFKEIILALWKEDFAKLLELSVKGTLLGSGEMALDSDWHLPRDGQLSVRKGFCGVCWGQVWREAVLLV